MQERDSAIVNHQSSVVSRQSSVVSRQLKTQNQLLNYNTHGSRLTIHELHPTS